MVIKNMIKLKIKLSVIQALTIVWEVMNLGFKLITKIIFYGNHA